MPSPAFENIVLQIIQAANEDKRVQPWKEEMEELVNGPADDSMEIVKTGGPSDALQLVFPAWGPLPFKQVVRIHSLHSQGCGLKFQCRARMLKVIACIKLRGSSEREERSWTFVFRHATLLVRISLKNICTFDIENAIISDANALSSK
jgi:hypothetical protein